MPKVKIRHALATWQESHDGPVLTAFRGQVVDMPEEHVNRLRVHGAVVSPDVELDRPGTLMELPESPSDEELVAWVMAASPAETQDLIERRPELRSRLNGAALRVTDDRRRMDEHLASVRNAISGIPAGTVIDGDVIIGAPTDASTGTDDDSTGSAEPPGSSAPAPPAAEEAPQPASLATLVQGTVSQIIAYLSVSPDEAEDVLDAETEARAGQPRAGVVAAVQAAIAGRQTQ